MGDVARPAVTLGHAERFHQVPAGEIGAADVTDLAGADEVVEGAQGFLDGGEGVEAVQLEEVDVVRAEAAEGRLRWT